VAGALCGAALLMAPWAGRAEPLAKEACDVLIAEHDKLVAAGVKGWMVQGAQDARTRLGADKLAQVARFVDVDEQLLFRCGHYKARFVLPADAEDPPAEPAAPAALTPAANGKAKSEPERKKAKQAATAPEPVDPAPAKPAARKKTKAEDAYRPATSPAVD
jgi:hypothetical protein